MKKILLYAMTLLLIGSICVNSLAAEPDAQTFDVTQTLADVNGTTVELTNIAFIPGRSLTLDGTVTNNSNESYEFYTDVMQVNEWPVFYTQDENAAFEAEELVVLAPGEQKPFHMTLASAVEILNIQELSSLVVNVWGWSPPYDNDNGDVCFDEYTTVVLPGKAAVELIDSAAVEGTVLFDADGKKIIDLGYDPQRNGSLICVACQQLPTGATWGGSVLPVLNGYLFTDNATPNGCYDADFYLENSDLRLYFLEYQPLMEALKFDSLETLSLLINSRLLVSSDDDTYKVGDRSSVMREVRLAYPPDPTKLVSTTNWPVLYEDARFAVRLVSTGGFTDADRKELLLEIENRSDCNTISVMGSYFLLNGTLPEFINFSCRDIQPGTHVIDSVQYYEANDDNSYRSAEFPPDVKEAKFFLEMNYDDGVNYYHVATPMITVDLSK